jgi:hypothetical protein
MASGSANNVYADVPVSANVTHAKQATVDDIVAEADAIYKEIVAAKLRDDDTEGQEVLLKRIQDNHKDFNASFPLALRWTVQTKQYKRAALVRYIGYVKGKEWKDRKEFLRDQGEYLVFLYRELHPKYDTRQVVQYRQAITAQLIKEDDEFEEIKKEAEKELKQRNEEIDQERRRRLYEFLVRQKVAAEQAAAARTSSTPHKSLEQSREASGALPQRCEHPGPKDVSTTAAFGSVTVTDEEGE